MGNFKENPAIFIDSSDFDKSEKELLAIPDKSWVVLEDFHVEFIGEKIGDKIAGVDYNGIEKSITLHDAARWVGIMVYKSKKEAYEWNKLGV